MRGARRGLLIGTLLLAAFPGPAGATEDPPPATDPSPVRRAFRTFGADGAWLFAFPKRTTPRGAWITAGVVAATALIAGKDDEIRAQVLEHPSATREQIADIFEPLGTYLVAGAGLGTAWIGGRAAGNDRLVATTAVAVEAWMWTAIITAGAKGLFGRQPPTPGHDEDGWFEDGTIFPSGHTSRSFAIAAVFADRYGRRAAWIGYPIAGLVGLATIEQDTHWASDVVAGAALGLAIGKGIASRHRPADRPVEGGGAPIAWSATPVRGGVTVTIVF